MRSRRADRREGGGRCGFSILRRGFSCPLDAVANSNPIHVRKRIRLTRALQSDGSCRVNRIRRRLSIRCAFASQSIETFFGFLARFFGPRGKVDANVFRSLGNLPGTFNERHKAWTRRPSPSPAAGRGAMFARSTHMDSTCRNLWGHTPQNPCSRAGDVM